MSKFNVGNNVRVHKNNGKVGTQEHDNYEKYVGETGVIIEIHGTNTYKNFVEFDNSNLMPCNWNDDELELVENMNSEKNKGIYISSCDEIGKDLYKDYMDFIESIEKLIKDSNLSSSKLISKIVHDWE